ncbi:CBS domain-containing protein [Pseudenhygromyxa sp. WMMC2535]|uniref:CBS domain-containing protein n=1 Tax=Pseudenhygromyxa sp. WMMC2535 TaxID=2712867 RepID=UPI0015550EFA|nr:CBS domain-containing protein [Pseudenhygromyxa sp. WMMC2535]NVB37156.1 CBS domain-containing protein [Pseudenhygromyxa sp. WMMC2535]
MSAQRSERAKTVGAVMTRDPVTISSDTSLADAAACMDDHGIRHLPVLEGDEVVGLVSERDLALISGIPGVDKDAVEVSEAMTAQPYVVAPEAALADVVRTMRDRKIGSAVVMDAGEVVGIFSVIDALGVLLTKLD